MPDLKASPRSGVLGYIADALRSARDKANEYEMRKNSLYHPEPVDE